MAATIEEVNLRAAFAAFERAIRFPHLTNTDEPPAKRKRFVGPRPHGGESPEEFMERLATTFECWVNSYER